MEHYLTPELQQGLAAARKLAGRRKSRLRVEVDGQARPILRLWQGGFALDAQDAPHLRGLVDVYDGARQVLQCLIVASEEEGGEMRYEFKRATPTAEAPPLDFVREADAPIGLIEKH